MFSKKEEEKRVGASDKFATAERMRQAHFEEEEGEGGARTGSQTIPVTIVFVLAVGLGMLLLNVGSAGAPTGGFTLGQILTGPAIPPFTGSPDIDHLILLLLRGVALSVVAAVVPVLAFVTVQVVGKRRLSFFVACWGVIIALPLIVYPLSDVFGPLLNSLLH